MTTVKSPKTPTGTGGAPRRGEKNRLLYEGDFTSLIAEREETVANGIGAIMHQGDYTTNNPFRQITDFYERALLSERATLEAEHKKDQPHP